MKNDYDGSKRRNFNSSAAICVCMLLAVWFSTTAALGDQINPDNAALTAEQLRNGSETAFSFNRRANGPRDRRNAQPVGLGVKRANRNAEVISESSLRTMRKEAAHRKRRIIQNIDGNDATFAPKRKPFRQGLLNVYMSGLENSQVDSIFYCTHWCFGTVIHRSKIATVLASKDAHPTLKHNCVQDLLDMGTDPLEVVGNFCRRHDIEFFCSFRMNDIHDGATDEKGNLIYPHLLSGFKRKHVAYLLGEPGQRLPGRPYGSRSACGVD